MSLQSLINHELEGRVGHQQQGREGAAPQCCHTLFTADLHDCICKKSEVMLKPVEWQYLGIGRGCAVTQKAGVSGRGYIFTVTPQSLNLQPGVHHPQRRSQKYTCHTWWSTGRSNETLWCRELFKVSSHGGSYLQRSPRVSRCWVTLPASRSTRWLWRNGSSRNRRSWRCTRCR